MSRTMFGYTKRRRLERGDTGTNTTTLIDRWSMTGAGSDLDARFTPSVDILELVAERSSEQTIEQPGQEAAAPTDATSSLLVKRAGEDEWQPLVLQLRASH